MTAILALASAMIVGAADFGGGLVARESSPFRVTARVQAFSFALLGVAVWFIDAPAITSTDIGAGAVAGVAGTFSFIALFAAFARGQISLLAPLTAIVGAMIPTLVGWLRGESLGTLQVVGIACAMLAVFLVSQDAPAPGEQRSTPPIAIGLALIAGAGFSLYFLALAETSADAGLWPLVAARSVSVPLAIAVALLATKGLAMPTRKTAAMMMGAGLAEGVASILVLWAFQRGPITIAASLSAFYPLCTVALARVVLKEELRTIQWFGVLFALAAIPLIAV